MSNFDMKAILADFCQAVTNPPENSSMLFRYLFTLQTPEEMYSHQNTRWIARLALMFLDLKTALLVTAFPLLLNCYDYLKILAIHQGLCWDGPKQDFNSIEGWLALFQDRYVAVGAVGHFVVMDLIGLFAITYHFHSKPRSKSLRYWFYVVWLATMALAPIGILLYIVTFFPRPWKNTKTTRREKRQLNSDPPHFGEQLSPLPRFVFYLLKGIVGTVGLVIFLVLYLLLVVFCGFYWFIYGSAPVVSNPPGKYLLPEAPVWFMPSFVRNATAALRLSLAITPRSEQGFFYYVKYLTMNPILQFACFLETGLEASNPRPLIGALANQYGDYFPFGDGVGVADRDAVKRILSSPTIQKGKESLGWRISSTMVNFCKISTVIHSSGLGPHTLVKKCRKIVHEWLVHYKTVDDAMEDPVFRELVSLQDGFSANKTYLVFGDALFYLATGNFLNQAEKDAYLDTVNNPLAFFPDWFNFLLFGGLLERKSNNSYMTLRKAFYDKGGEGVTSALDMADQLGINQAEALRLISSVYAIAGAAAPAKLTFHIFERISSDPKYLAMYQDNPRNFILECARLDIAVPIVNCYAEEEFKTKIGNVERVIPKGTPLHCAIVMANSDVDKFDDPLLFNPNRGNLESLMTWNCVENVIHDPIDQKSEFPFVRRCPGHDVSLALIQCIIDSSIPNLFQAADGCVVTGPEPTVLPIEFRSQKEIGRLLDPFTRMMITYANQRTGAWNENPPTSLDIQKPQFDYHGMLPVESITEFNLPMFDEDADDEAMKVRVLDFGAKQAHFMPKDDLDNVWNTAEEGIKWRVDVLSDSFPNITVDYGADTTSDAVLSRLAFFGLGCHITELCTDKQLPASYKYQNDNSILGDFEVREGFERYGSTAYFNKKQELEAIFVSYTNETYTSEDKMWEEAKWIWKTSMFTLVTVRDHLVWTHLMDSNALAKAVNTLPAKHWMRLFLKPFIFRTINVNYLSAQTLFNKNGVMDRVWGFKNHEEVLDLAKKGYNFENRERLFSKSMAKTKENFPIREDFPKFKKTITSYVQAAYNRNYDQRNDAEYEAKFLAVVQEQLGFPNVRGYDFVRVVSHLLVGVSGIHQHVGQISDIQTSPSFTGVKIIKGRTMDNIQSYISNISLSCSTGYLEPGILESWEHLCPTEGDKEDYLRFHEELLEREKEVREANKVRKYPFRSFDPSVVNCGVSR